MPEMIFGIDIRAISVVLTLVFLPIVFYVVLNFLALVEKLLSFIEKILIRVFGEFVGRIFRFIFAVLSAIIGGLKFIFSFGRSKRSRRVGG